MKLNKRGDKLGTLEGIYSLRTVKWNPKSGILKLRYFRPKKKRGRK